MLVKTPPASRLKSPSWRAAAALEKHGTKHTLKGVPGTHHGFQFSARPDFEPKAAEATWDELFDLWERTLR